VSRPGLLIDLSGLLYDWMIGRPPTGNTVDEYNLAGLRTMKPTKVNAHECLLSRIRRLTTQKPLAELWDSAHTQPD
jgi:hypothetical protein